MQPIYNFILWFSISLVGTFFLVTMIANPFVKSFIISIIVAIVATKDG